ncbi:MAG: hypothetical protein IJL27_04310, partial [Firmicutes bacterium]|nr:hypothetical protein [Bacillota bacterium]
MRNKILKTAALILTAALAAALPFSTVFAEDGVVHILNAEDLKELAENCSYDAWSMGRTVSLDRDISLGGDAFSPIPGFEGTFLGNGHTISGLSITGSGSPAGLFAVLGENAEVKDLNVEGTVSPAGDCRRTGGIAGKNSGTISNCTFTGTVNGRSMTGGIAGENTSRGTIISCRASGGAFGRSMTGGICGKNSGLVSSCTGSAFVNTRPSDPSFSVTEAGADMILGLKSLVSPDTYDIPTDCGGIAGFSDGSIESCRNEGTVGYQSIGYNTGGIAGRTSGVILNCKNSGPVSGRRNAGGIAGLAEPYISVVMTPDRLDALRSELDGLDRMIQSALDDASDTSDSVSERLSALRAAVNGAAKTADDIGKKAGSYADDAASELESAEDVIKNSLDLLSRADEDMIKASSELGRSLRDLSRAADSLDSDVADEIRSGVSDIDRASDILDAATEEFKKADSLIRSAVSSPESTTAEDLKLIPQAIASGIGIIKNGRPEDDGGALAYAQRGIQALERGIENSDAPVPDLEDALDEASAASSGLTASLKDLEAVLTYLESRQAPDIKAPEIGEDTDRLYDSMTRISDQLALLDQEVGPSSEKLIEDVRKIEERFRAVTQTLLGAADDVMGASAEDIADDVSQVDPMTVTDGKTALCENEGQISCDVNGGGIAGSMSVFDPLDPESDSPVTISSALHRTYQYRCVILRCTDTGAVTVKKSCAGGICGDQSLGLITECTAASDVSCESGDLAGGIAGRSGSVIRGCWSKSSVSARRYSGGITGGSDDEDSRLLVEDCRALCEGDRSQDACGAISGGSSGSFKNNFFCSDSLGGINGLSIKGAAEPVSYEELVKGGSVPQQMRSLTLSFTADGAQVKTIGFNYGDSFGPDIFPQVPQKDGEYGRWDRDELTDLHFDTEVRAVYRPYIRSIASGIERKDGRPVFIAVGSFSEDDVLAPVPAALDFDPGRESLADRI